MEELYRRKREYENFINNLNNIYEKLEECYSNLLFCKKKMISCLNVDDNIYSDDSFENIVRDVKEYKIYIHDYIIPSVKEEYNEIMLMISSI